MSFGDKNHGRKKMKLSSQKLKGLMKYIAEKYEEEKNFLDSMLEKKIELDANLEEYLEFQQEIESGDNQTLKEEVAVKIGEQKDFIKGNAFLINITRYRLKELQTVSDHFKRNENLPPK